MRTHARPPTTPGPRGLPGVAGPPGAAGGGLGADLLPASDVVVAANISLVVSGIYELAAGITLELGVGAVMDIL